jgi:hypothetical protein
MLFLRYRLYGHVHRQRDDQPHISRFLSHRFAPEAVPVTSTQSIRIVLLGATSSG